MTKLANILISKIAGPAPSLRDLAADLKSRTGSGRKAAKAMGVNESTFRRILSGQTRTPKAGTERLMREAAVRTRGTTKDDLRMTFSYDGRDRNVGASNLKLADGTVEAMGTAYARGDREGVARAFIDGIGDRWYHDRFEDVYDDDVRGEETTDQDYSPGYGA